MLLRSISGTGASLCVRVALSCSVQVVSRKSAVPVTVQSEVFESLACDSGTPAAGGLSVRRPASQLSVNCAACYRWSLCLTVCHLSGHVFLTCLLSFMLSLCSCSLCEMLKLMQSAF